MKVTITKEDLVNANLKGDPLTDCLLATALKRSLKTNHLHVGFNFATIYDTIHTIPTNVSDLIHEWTQGNLDKVVKSLPLTCELTNFGE